MKKHYFLILGFILLGLAQANMIWPAIIVEQRLLSIPIIILSLIIELFFYKWIFSLNLTKAIYYTLAANILSAILGLFFRPISGFLYELSFGGLINWVFDWGTFNPIAWFFVPIIDGAINAILELLTIRSIWKNKITKKNFMLTWGINILTVTIATLSLLIWPAKI